LSKSLGIIKKKPPRDCSKPKKYKWDEKAITILRNVKNRSRKIIKDWKKWKSGKEPKSGSWKSKLKRNICFINKHIISFKWEVDILLNWDLAQDTLIYCWAKKVINLAEASKKNFVKIALSSAIAKKVKILKEKYEYYPKEFFKRFMGIGSGGAMVALRDPNTGEMTTNDDEKLDIMYSTWSSMFVSKKEKPKVTPVWL